MSDERYDCVKVNKCVLTLQSKKVKDRWGAHFPFIGR